MSRKDDIIETLNVVAQSMDIIDEETLDLDKGFHDNNFDSLEIVEFVMEVEKEFNILLDDDRVFDCKTMNDFIRLIEERLDFK